MNTTTPAHISLVDGWRLESCWLVYVVGALLLGLAIRLVLALIRSCEKAADADYLTTVWTLFKGKDQGKLVRDYWQPYILGVIELLAYPVLLRTDHLEVIGAWIGFKTIAHWKEWSENRAHFNRFLIGNALVAFASVLLLARMVVVNP